MTARVLIIEDNSANLELVRYLLEAHGYATLSATNGLEGLTLIREERPDLVLCDLQKPVMDGYQVLRAIRDDPLLRNTVVVAVTAFSMAGDSAAAYAAGFDGYVSKPIVPEIFVAQVEVFLRPDARASRSEANAAHGRGREDRRVLVVDDNATNRELLVHLVKHRNLVALEAADGAEALAIARKEQPDLVICDILMPTMDGYEFVRQLRADPEISRIEVIFYSAYYREQEAINLAKDCGVLRVLVKPSPPEAILEAIDEALSNEGRSPAPVVPETFDREHLRLMTDKLTEKVEKLAVAHRRLSALTHLNLRLASERDPHTLLDEMCKGSRDLIGAKYAVLCVRDKNDHNETYWTTSGIDTTAGELAPPQLDRGALGEMMLDATPRRFANAGDNSQSAGLPVGYPSAKSTLVCPIISLHVTYGWIALLGKLGADEFSEEDERLLAIHGAQVGRIYENGSLYQQIQRHAAQLQASELRFRQLAENIQEVFFLIAADLRQVLYVSPAYESVWGRSCKSLYDDPTSWIDSIHPDDRETALSANSNGKAGSGVDYEYRILRADGAERWIRARAFPIRDETGSVYRFAGIAEDITNRKEAETRIVYLNRVYAVLSGINALIVRVRNRSELFREACRIAVDVGEFAFAWMGVVDPATRSVQAVAWHGDRDGDAYLQLLPRKLGDAPPDSLTLLGRAIAEGRPMVVDDIENDTRLPISQQLPRRGLGLHSLAILPLEDSGRIDAVLVLYAREIAFFDADEMKLLLELAGDISYALDHIAKQEKIDYLAFYDPLTGLPNRNLFRERLAQRVNAANSEQRRLAVVLMDIDRFNTVNDTLGRQAGDELLKMIAARCLLDATESALIGRLVGDQFAGVIPDVKAEDDVARTVEQRNHDLFGAPYSLRDTELRLSAKFGIAVLPDDGTDADTLLKNAEAALKRAKATGDRYLFYAQQMSERVAGHLSLENNLRQALENNEFVLHYQPKVDAQTRTIVGVEALIRWQSPDLGLVQPLQFIPLLEETGMIREVGAWALQQAATDQRTWRSQNIIAPRIAVNVSAIQLRHRDFVDRVKGTLGQGGTPAALDIEITESVIMEDIAGIIDKLKMLRDLGVGIAIDDFGTGYSSLGYLTKLPVHSLKIDRSFIVTMADDPDTLTLVSTIISLAHSLRLEVCAEGVETEEQARVLRLLRCDQIQGYLISRPVPVHELSPMLRTRDA